MNNTVKYEDILKDRDFFIKSINGVSMMPLLNENKDTVKIKRISEPLKKYDVVLFKRHDGKYVLHRIIKVKKDYFLICGDNQVIKEKVYPDQIIGIMEGYFKGEEYHSIEEKDYLRYSKRRVRSRFFRFILNIPRMVYHKLFRKK